MIRRFSLSYLVLGALFITIVLFNLSILTNKDSSNLETSKINGATYYTGGSHKVQSHVNNVESEEFTKSLLKELEDTKKEELLDELREKMAKTEKTSILQTLKTELKLKYSEDIKKIVRKEIEQEQTNEFFKQSRLSFKTLEDLTLKYSLEHKDVDLKLSSILQILQDEKIVDESTIQSATSKFFDRRKYFQYLLLDILLNNKPKCEGFKKDEYGQHLNPTYQWDARVISENYLKSSNIKMSGEKFTCLQNAHDEVVKQLKTLPDPPSQFINGYGIVINGGGNMIGAALTSIANLRDQGSQLPIELILDTEEEYDKEICEVLLPNKLNAKCKIVENEIGKDLFNKIDEKFSRKILGILISSFDHTIALDADNFAIKNIDNLLTTEPYLSTKMILWPDLWVKLTSPLFYKIARIEKGEPIHRFGISNDQKFEDYITKDKMNDIHYHDFSGLPSPISVETGQLVFSKKEHLKSLLLALYYNINSKDWYEELIYQGAYGPGDRETIVPALHVMNERYTLDFQKVFIYGYKAENGKDSETTLGQTDPRDSYDFYKDWRTFLSKKNLDTRLNPWQSGGFTERLLDQFKDYKRKILEDAKLEDEQTAHRVIDYKLPEILFLHCNHPKIDPVKNSQEGEYGVYSRRNMGLPKDIQKSFNMKDWELKFHSLSRWVACDLLMNNEHFWNNIAKLKQSDVCESVSNYIKFLRKDTFDPSSESTIFTKQKVEESQQNQINKLENEIAAPNPNPNPEGSEQL
ncbi:unnamed protein product [Candida verbasci]|uniref:Alpha-1,2-mannosyltransferase n=1 Tax=Candida verbasci TaxID=1227364 RepID=A0A9W4U1I0_9ASCO|nr:unnamed protein product [Candida verbasci]